MKDNGEVRRGLYAEDRDRIIKSVRESVEEAGQGSENSAYYFIIGLSLSILVGIIIVQANIKYKNNQLEVYGEKIEQEIVAKQSSQIKDLELSDLSSQINALELTLTQRTDIAKLLEDLRANQYKSSKWNSISIEPKKVNINMQADNFDDLSKSLKSFENLPSIEMANLSDVNVESEDNITFTVELNVNWNNYKLGLPK